MMEIFLSLPAEAQVMIVMIAILGIVAYAIIYVKEQHR